MIPFQCQFLLDISERNPEGILMNMVISPKSAKMPVAVKAIDVYTPFSTQPYCCLTICLNFLPISAWC